MGRADAYKRQRAHVLRENPKFFKPNENGGPPSREAIIEEFNRLTADNAYGRNPKAGAERPEGGVIPTSPVLKAVDTNKSNAKLTEGKALTPRGVMDISKEHVKKELGAKPKAQRPSPKELVVEPKDTDQLPSVIPENADTPAIDAFDWAGDLATNQPASPDKPVQSDQWNDAPAPETFEGGDGWSTVPSTRTPRTKRAIGQGSSADSRGCFNCGEEGHMKSECPMPPKTGGRECHKCGEVGHIARECPNQDAGFGGGGGSSDNRACFKCQQTGHISRDCPNQDTTFGGRSSDNRACFNCKQTGHISRDCPLGGPGKGGAECFNCGEMGHKSFECSKPGGSSGAFRGTKPAGGGGACYKCGKPGHFARECPGGIEEEEAFPAFDDGGFDTGFGTNAAFETDPGYDADVGSGTGTAAADDGLEW